MFENLKKSAKQAWNTTTGFCKKHKKAIIGTVVTAGTIIAGKAIWDRNHKPETDEPENAFLPEAEPTEPYNYGRDGYMKFFTNEGEEVEGTVPCTESYFNDIKEVTEA